MPTFNNTYTLISRDVSLDISDRMTTIHKVIDYFTFEYRESEIQASGNKLGVNTILFQNANQFAVTSAWYAKEKLKEDTKFRFKLNIITPSGVRIEGTEESQTIPKGFNRFSANFILDAVPVVEAGEYTMSVDLLSEEGVLLASGEYIYTVNLKKVDE